jgi:hypothetical protein
MRPLPCLRTPLSGKRWSARKGKGNSSPGACVDSTGQQALRPALGRVGQVLEEVCALLTARPFCRCPRLSLALAPPLLHPEAKRMSKEEFKRAPHRDGPRQGSLLRSSQAKRLAICPTPALTPAVSIACSMTAQFEPFSGSRGIMSAGAHFLCCASREPVYEVRLIAAQ